MCPIFNNIDLHLIDRPSICFNICCVSINCKKLTFYSRTVKSNSTAGNKDKTSGSTKIITSMDLAIPCGNQPYNYQ